MGGCGSCSNPQCNCASGSCTCVSHLTLMDIGIQLMTHRRSKHASEAQLGISGGGGIEKLLTLIIFTVRDGGGSEAYACMCLGQRM